MDYTPDFKEKPEQSEYAPPHSNYDVNSREDLYEIWQEVNGYPKEITHEDWQKFWATKPHRITVAIDLTAIIFIIVAIACIAGGATFLFQLKFALLWIISFAITTRLILPLVPATKPIGNVLALSTLSTFFGFSKVWKSIQPPPIHKVDLETLPVMARLAEYLAGPTLTNLENTLWQLDLQLNEINKEVAPLKKLSQDIEHELKRSDREWQSILGPKHDQVKKLIAKIQSQADQLLNVRANIQADRDSLLNQVLSLTAKQDILERIANLNSDNATSTPVSTYTGLVQDLQLSIQQTVPDLTEAQNIATAHEQAKAEIALLLDN